MHCDVMKPEDIRQPFDLDQLDSEKPLAPRLWAFRFGWLCGCYSRITRCCCCSCSMGTSYWSGSRGSSCRSCYRCSWVGSITTILAYCHCLQRNPLQQEEEEGVFDESPKENVEPGFNGLPLGATNQTYKVT